MLIEVTVEHIGVYTIPINCRYLSHTRNQRKIEKKNEILKKQKYHIENNIILCLL